MVAYNSNYEGTLNFSDMTPHLSLIAGSELTYTVPGTSINKYQAVFSYQSNSAVFVGYNVTAAVPSADTIVATNGIEFKPEKRLVKGGDVLHFITPDATAYMGVSFRAIPG